MWDLLLVASVGFAGSFGHCVGMCGPLAITFSLQQSKSLSFQEVFLFHLWLNLGRLLSYVGLGIGIGFIGEVISAVGSDLRRGISFLMGLLLIWLGFLRVAPGFLPQIPLWQTWLHDRLQGLIQKLAGYPIGMGLIWGFVPCGFLYTAQLSAASTDSWWHSALIMASFGLGTLPAMIGIGFSANRFSAHQKQWLGKLGGWITLLIGIQTVLRDEGTLDYASYGAVICLLLALIARPISLLCQGFLHYRRALGVGGFLLALIHLLHILSHSFQWQFTGFLFLLPIHQQGIIAASLAMILLLPLAITSTDGMVQKLGNWWRRLHLLSVPGFMLVTIHIVCSSSHFLGGISSNSAYYRSIALIAVSLVILLCRLKWFWKILGWEKWYVSYGNCPQRSGISECRRDLPH